MSIVNDITRLGPAAEKRQVYSPFEKYWSAFLEWRQRDKLRTQLCQLTDSELADIGITRGEIDYFASNGNIDPRSIPFAG